METAKYRMRADANQVVVEQYGFNKKKNVETWKAISFHSRFEDAASWILERLARDKVNDGGDWRQVVDAIRASKVEVLDMLLARKAQP